MATDIDLVAELIVAAEEVAQLEEVFLKSLVNHPVSRSEVVTAMDALAKLTRVVKATKAA